MLPQTIPTNEPRVAPLAQGAADGPAAPIPFQPAPDGVFPHLGGKGCARVEDTATLPPTVLGSRTSPDSWAVIKASGCDILVDEADVGIIETHGLWVGNTKSGAFVRARERLTQRSFRLARLLVDAPPGAVVDHINGNPLDNRRCNLRVVSYLENAWNTAKRSNTLHRFKGVWCKHGHWVAEIVCNNKRRHIGRFPDEESAARAYDEAARDLFGEYAALNFPKAGEQSAHRQRTRTYYTQQVREEPDIPRTLALLQFIQGYQEAHSGVSPSFSEMARGVPEMKNSTGNVTRDVAKLERSGHIRRLHDRARAIQVLRPIAIPRAPDGCPAYFIEIGRAGQATRPASVSRGSGSSAVSKAGVHLHGGDC